MKEALLYIAGPVVNQMELHLLSSRAADNSIFQAKLTFNVSNGPPSKVVCTYQHGSSSESTISSFQIHREVIRAHYVNSSLPDVTHIVLKQNITRRQGIYKCTVTVEGRSGIEQGSTYERVTMGTPQVSIASITGKIARNTKNTFIIIYIFTQLQALPLMSLPPGMATTLSRSLGLPHYHHQLVMRCSIRQPQAVDSVQETLATLN